MAKRGRKKDNPDRGLKQYKDGRWGVYCIIGGRKFRRKVGTKNEARQFYNELKRIEATGGILPGDQAHEQQSLGQLLKHYVDHDACDMTAARNAEKWIDIVGHLYPADLTVDEVNRLVGLYGTGKAPATVHRFVHPLKRALNLAVAKGNIEASLNPFAKRGLIRLPRINNRRERFLEPEEEEQIEEVATEAEWQVVDFALQTGVRQGDQLSLARDDADLRRGYIVLKEPKSGKAHHVPLNPRAKQIIEEQLDSHDSEFVFPAPKGGKWTASNFRRRFWKPLFERAGLHDLRWHDLRHSAASRLIEAGVPAAVVQKLLDHQDPRTTDRYTHVRDDTLKRAVGVLDGSEAAPSVQVEKLQRENDELRSENDRLRGAIEGCLSEMPEKYRKVFWDAYHSGVFQEARNE